MDRRSGLPEKPRTQQRARIERSVLQGLHDLRRSCIIRSRGAGYAPQRWRQPHGNGRGKFLDLAIRIEPQGQRTFNAITGHDVVKHGGGAGEAGARPFPRLKIPFQRRSAGVAVEIAVTAPPHRRLLECNLHMGGRGDGPPPMTPGGVEREGAAGERLRVDADGTANSPRCRRRHLINANHKSVAIPGEPAWPDRQRGRCPADLASSALGHGPTFSIVAVERDVDRAMIERVGFPVRARPGVIGREDAADEGDDREAVLSVIAQCVDIPPRVTAGRDVLIESKSARSAAAANWPEIAAIGTPGPGCALPPAR